MLGKRANRRGAPFRNMSAATATCLPEQRSWTRPFGDLFLSSQQISRQIIVEVLTQVTASQSGGAIAQAFGYGSSSAARFQADTL